MYAQEVKNKVLSSSSAALCLVLCLILFYFLWPPSKSRALFDSVYATHKPKLMVCLLLGHSVSVNGGSAAARFVIRASLFQLLVVPQVSYLVVKANRNRLASGSPASVGEETNDILLGLGLLTA